MAERLKAPVLKFQETPTPFKTIHITNQDINYLFNFSFYEKHIIIDLPKLQNLRQT